MISSLKDAFLTVTSFLSSRNAPPFVSAKDAKRLAPLNHMESKKFYIVLVSVGILAFFYFASIAIMFLLPSNSPEFVSGFVTLFSKTIEVLAIIIASYVGAQAVIDLKYNSKSSSALDGEVQVLDEVTVIQTNTKEDDYEIK